MVPCGCIRRLTLTGPIRFLGKVRTQQLLHLFDDLRVLPVQVRGLLQIVVQVIQLSGRSILLDSAVFNVAILVTGVRDGRWAAESMRASFGRRESAASLGSDVHPLAFANRQMRWLAGSQNDVISKWFFGVAGQCRQHIYAVSPLPPPELAAA